MTFREVDRSTWADFETLFESRGAPSYCWCMAWRATGPETKRTDAASRKAMMKARVDAGTPVGILGYLDGEPIAWCSIAPRSTYRSTLVDPRPGDERENVWSLVCFYVKREHRRRGAFGALLEAARRYAKERGATVLEAYPVDEDSPSYRFGGFVPAYLRAGFVEVGRAGSRRHVVRLSL
ncbi:MAG TPA: GNAT family N-acetyltransferase [Sandaracinaceae bacterium]